MNNNMMNNEEILTEKPSENKQSRVHYIELKDGLNSIKTQCLAGSLHLWVRNGKLMDITLYNAKISKKETTTDNYGSHVKMQVKLDWEHLPLVISGDDE